MLHLVLRCFQFFEYTSFCVWRLFIHLGYFATLLLSKLYFIVVGVLNGIVILGEEFQNFVFLIKAFIDSLVDYYCFVGNTTFRLIVYLLENISGTLKESIFNREALEEVSKDIAVLLQRSIDLIVDIAWWLVTLLPITIYKLFSTAADVCRLTLDTTLECIGAFFAVMVQSFMHSMIMPSFFLIFYIYWNNILEYIFRIPGAMLRKARDILHITLLWLLPLTRSSLLKSIRRSPQRCTSPRDDSKLLDHQRCVVCKSRGKCVLLWPCRHLCLCEECADVLNEQNTYICPLCRTQVELSISVYM